MRPKGDDIPGFEFIGRDGKMHEAKSVWTTDVHVHREQS